MVVCALWSVTLARLCPMTANHQTPQGSPSARQLATAYGVALVVMGVLDALWLGVVASGFYAAQMGALMADSIRLVPALLFYLLYPVAIVGLALVPVPATRRIATLRSAALGLTAYGVYDLSNLATLRGWSLPLTLVDIVWGTLATCVAGTLAYRWALGKR